MPHRRGEFRLSQARSVWRKREREGQMTDEKRSFLGGTDLARTCQISGERNTKINLDVGWIYTCNASASLTVMIFVSDWNVAFLL